MNKVLLLNILFWIFSVFAIIYITYIYYEFTHIKEGNVFQVIPDTFNKVADLFNQIARFFKYMGKIFTCYIPGVMGWLFDHLKCAGDKIGTLFDCFVYYLLEVFGKIIYFPVMLIFWFSNSTDLENKIWDTIEGIDKKIFKSSGLHICHYSDYVIKKCYKCEIRRLVHPPKW